MDKSYTPRLEHKNPDTPDSVYAALFFDLQKMDIFLNIVLVKVQGPRGLLICSSAVFKV